MAPERNSDGSSSFLSEIDATLARLRAIDRAEAETAAVASPRRLDEPTDPAPAPIAVPRALGNPRVEKGPTHDERSTFHDERSSFHDERSTSAVSPSEPPSIWAPVTPRATPPVSLPRVAPLRPRTDDSGSHGRLLEPSMPKAPPAPVPVAAPEPIRVAVRTVQTDDFPPQAPDEPSPRMRLPFLLLGVAALVLIGIVGTVVIRGRMARASAASLPEGRLTVESRPAGAEITIDGQKRGATPLTLVLDVGTHTLAVRGNGQDRTMPVQLKAGTELQQYFDFTAAAPRVDASSGISVVSDPPRAQVSVDGVRRGLTPVTIDDLTPGEHRVTVKGETGSADRTVTVDRGATASLVVSLPKSSSLPIGWLTVSAPFESQIFEQNGLLGTSGATKIMLQGGRHDITLVNQALGFRESRKIDVTPGKVVTITVQPPKAELSANARPWAEVSIDGKRVGQTPIARISVPIGPHEVLFEHPQLGSRKETVMVTATGPNRISVDLSK